MTAASAQISVIPGAYLWIEIENGVQKATLTVPVASPPAGLHGILAGVMGCRAAADPSDAVRPTVRCAMNRSSRLTYESHVRLAALAEPLRQAGLRDIEILVTGAGSERLRLSPPLGSGRGRYEQAHYTLDQLPPDILIECGFAESDAQTLIGGGAALLILPLVLLLAPVRNLIHLTALVRAVSVLGAAAWAWVLLASRGPALVSFLLAETHFPRSVGTLLAIAAVPLAALWTGTHFAAIRYAKLSIPGIDAEQYRRSKFWLGAAIVWMFSGTAGMLNLSSPDGLIGMLLIGVGLAAGCVLRLLRLSRGGSHPLAPGVLRTRILELAAKAGVGLRDVNIMTAANPRPPAAFAGRQGLVFLNESLLARLSRREVDAIVCHELSHLAPASRKPKWVVWFAVVAIVIGAQWLPAVSNAIPIFMVGGYLAFQAWRRSAERKADFDSVRWSGDPEAMITGLSRVSAASGMPLEWGPPVSWLLGHPSTMERLRAIARAGGVPEPRLIELIEESKVEASDHYSEENRVAEDAAFSQALRKRLQVRLGAYSLVAPVLFGLASEWLFEAVRFPWWAVLAAGLLLSMVAFYIGYEVLVGSVRSAVRRRAIARDGQGVFAGLALAAEPRVYDGQYHNDLGLVRFTDQGIEFAGDRARFVLDSRLITRVWLGDGPPHWTPRKVVCIECRVETSAPVRVVSLQSFEARFWPNTSAAAQRLFAQIEKHRSSTRTEAPIEPCTLPEAAGEFDTPVSLRSALRFASIYAAVALAAGNFRAPFSAGGIWEPSYMINPALICGTLAIFVTLPRMRRVRRQS